MMEELKKELSSLREFVVLQSKEIVKLKRGSRLENETDDYNRLACIEEELSEQKRSQDKITRLCQAAIKALERIEDKPIISTNGSECSTPISTSKESVCGSIDPTVVKSLCGQIEKLTSMLVKVDEDIDDLDERTEDNKQQVDGLRERFLSLNDLEKRMSGDYLRREVDARIMIKDLVTKSDLSRGLKTIPFGLSKDDVSSMIEYATSNYLRTVQVCGEKLEDFEEKVNMELKSLQNKVVDIEETLKNHLSNIEDKTDKRIKEVEKKIGRGSGDLEVVVRELDTKVKDVSKGRGTLETKVRELEVKTKELEKAKGTGMESVLKDMDTKIKSVDSKNKDFTSKMKDFEKKLDTLDVNSKIKTIQDSISSINSQLKALKDDNKANSDEARVTARLERLGKEISVLKTKHVDIVSTLDDLTKRRPTQGT